MAAVPNPMGTLSACENRLSIERSKRLEAWYCAPPDRDFGVVQIAIADGPIVAEIHYQEGELVLTCFGLEDGTPVTMPIPELIAAVQKAESILSVRE
jgi:hypothetical protein